MRKYREYTDQDIHDKAKRVYSLAGLLKALDIKPAGGNYINMKRLLQKLNVDCSHWRGQAWSKDQRTKNWSEYSKVSGFKKHLIKDRGNVCECCKNGEWLQKPILLEVHHRDGDRTNNKLVNLELLCPNCHSFTSNFRNRNEAKTKEEIMNKWLSYVTDICLCGQIKRKTSVSCRKCNAIKRKMVATRGLEPLIP